MKIVILKSKSFPNKQVILTRLYIHTYMKNWYFMHNFGPLVDYSKKNYFKEYLLFKINLNCLQDGAVLYKKSNNAAICYYWKMYRSIGKKL